MYLTLLAASIIIFLSIIFHRLSSKIAIPTLFAFIILGMLFGSDGILKIPFDDLKSAEYICSTAFIFIIFYGGFGTKWSTARPVALKAISLSTIGVLLTAGLIGFFCHFILKLPLLESFLIGSVISSTDAASVFSILRSKKLNLKDNTASLIELESGSNDPCAYMLTLIFISIMQTANSHQNFFLLITKQLVFGVLFGTLIAFAAYYILNKARLSADLENIFILAIALMSYAIPTLLDGNGYLSVYLSGIILGNLKIPDKTPLVHFFDGITDLMEILVFFLLGLLSFPNRLLEIAPVALSIALFLTFIARPISVCLLLSFFKSPKRQMVFVSWCGLRGAASIVFAMIAVLNIPSLKNDLFHIVFFIVLFSILIQGSLIPLLANKLGIIDDSANVLKTFTDYIDEVPVQFIQLTLSNEHPWVGRQINSLKALPDTLIILIKRNGKDILPTGELTLLEQDTLIISALAPATTECVTLTEKVLEKDDAWIEQPISSLEIDHHKLIILIKRSGDFIIPHGNTILKEHDILVINQI